MKDIKRRDFIKMSAGAGLGSLVVPAALTTEHDKGTDPNDGIEKNVAGAKKVIVAGAGIAGLCCAYELMKKGHDVTVLEATGRHGGHVFTVHDGLSDGLYGDFGAEHFTKPGYEKYWEYVKELNLTALPYPRRKNLLRRIDGKFYTEEMLADPAVLKKMGFNEKEVTYLSKNPFWDLESVYVNPYLDKFTDEYQPFNVGYDHLDKTPIAEMYKKDGASATALAMLGGAKSSVLFELWRSAILRLRGVPQFPVEVFRLKDGNQMLPTAFAKKLGTRVWLNCPVLSIKHSPSGVTVTYKQHNKEQEMSADYLVNCIPLPALKAIPVEPAFPAEKQFVIENVAYDSYQRFVFQASSKFWLEDKLSINMELAHPDLWQVWHSADEVDTQRVIVLGTGPGGISVQRALAAFREVYPGKGDTIEQAVSRDWTKEAFLPPVKGSPSRLANYTNSGREIMKPHGRIHFAGAYADNLNWGMEASTRSANRVADAIHKA